MAIDYSKTIRLGAGNPIVEEVGGDFTTPLLDLGETHPEGITIRFTGNDKNIGSAQSTLVSEVLPAAMRECIITFRCKENYAETLALSMGLPMSVVDDDTSGSPDQREFEVGDYEAPEYYALRFKAPQTDDPDLFDIWTFYKGRFVAAFEQAQTYENERWIPLEFRGVRNDSGKLFKVEIEGEGDLP